MTRWQQFKTMLATTTSLLAIVVFLAPFNEPLYNLILFPCPDPRTPDQKSAFASFKAVGINCREVTFFAINGNRLHGIMFERPDTRYVFLHSHGKGNSMYISMQKARLMLACGASVFMYDYQGFGRSQGRPTVQSTCDDAVAAYDYLRTTERRTPKDIIAVGESWGGGVVGQLVGRRPVSAVIIHSGFASLKTAGMHTLPWLRLYPDWCFPRDMVLDNVAIFKQKHPPLLLVHGITDPIIPCSEARTLFNEACEPKSILLLPKGHSSLGNGFLVATIVRNFLQEQHLFEKPSPSP
jgi:dienelactone hydrolase